MSIIQVMDSSKSGRAIYVVAAGLIVVSIAIAFLQLLQWEIILTVESGVGLVPIIGLFSISLWITQPDRRVVEYSVMKDIYEMKELAQIKVRMASALLYIMPWESSPKSAFTIEESLRKDLERTLRSPELKEQIDNYKQAFWLRLLTPFSLVTLAAFYQIPFWILAIVGIAIGFALAYLLLKENENTPTRILEYAFARWFQEGTSTDLSRRKSGFGRKSNVKEILEATLEIVTPTIDLAVRGDWRGFDRKSRNLEELLGIPKPDCLSWSLILNFLVFLRWSVILIHGPNSRRIDICLQNAKLQIIDSITLLNEARENPFSEEEVTISKLMSEFIKYTGSRDTILKMPTDFYTLFDKNVLSHLLDNHYEFLMDAPFQLNNTQAPKRESGLSNLERLATNLVMAAEQEFLDMILIMKTISSWKVQLSKLENTLGPLSAKCILENDIGWNLAEIHEVIHSVAPKLYLVDFDKMIKNLDIYREREGENNHYELLTSLRDNLRFYSYETSPNKKILHEIHLRLDDYIEKLELDDG